MAPTVLEIQGSGTRDEESTPPLNSPPSLTITLRADDNPTPSVNVDCAQKSLHASPVKIYSASKLPSSEIPSSLKKSPKGQGTGFSKQEIMKLQRLSSLSVPIQSLEHLKRKINSSSGFALSTTSRLQPTMSKMGVLKS